MFEYIAVTVCPFCGQSHEIAVRLVDYFDWQAGTCAQDAFPYLSAEEREMLISGICPDCWNSMFGQEEDEDGIPDEDWGYNEDEGFDPYLGEYTWDC